MPNESRNPTAAVYTYDPPTVLKGRRYTLKPNQELMFRGGSFPQHRRQFTVTNPHATLNLQLRSQETGIYDAGAEPDDGFAVLVFPSQSITLFTSANVVIRNANDGSNVACIIAEIFYL